MNSTFLRVKCKCGQERTVFSHTTTPLHCSSCDTPLVVPRGGEAAIFGKIVKEVG